MALRKSPATLTSTRADAADLRSANRTDSPAFLPWRCPAKNAASDTTYQYQIFYENGYGFFVMDVPSSSLLLMPVDLEAGGSELRPVVLH